MSTTAELVVTNSKASVGPALCRSIALVAKEALEAKGSFTIALSGGSLPGFLSGLPAELARAGVEDPSWKSWHVLLADERCVPETDPDSNMGSIYDKFLRRTSIPISQVYGIDQGLLLSGAPTAAIAEQYEATLRAVLGEDGRLDLAVLGFGPDGHTCSLFPGHSLLEESGAWVAPITDSPKPPPNRITLTFPFLNHHTQHAIFCGAGASKQPIVSAVFPEEDIRPSDEDAEGLGFEASVYSAVAASPAPYPCGMVRPTKSLRWIVDRAAVGGMGLLSRTKADAVVLPTGDKKLVAGELCRRIVRSCAAALSERGAFSIALSGGSLPSLLAGLHVAFVAEGVDPHYEKWHVLLADERGVARSDPDSNLGALTEFFLGQASVSIPDDRIHELDQAALAGSIGAAAEAYAATLASALEDTGGELDLAVLGFGPDGHTCSLFAGHPLLHVQDRLVAPISDSPKPPSERITLTFRVLNEMTRDAIFCGMGASKSPILKKILVGARRVDAGDAVRGASVAECRVEPAFPCGMVRPKNSLAYIVDEAAMREVVVAAAAAPVVDGVGASSRLPRPLAARVHVNPTKKELADDVCAQIVRYCSVALEERGEFSIALSGGSLPKLLSGLPAAFRAAGVEPRYEAWHVLLADERCVPEDHPDSNMGGIAESFLGHPDLHIPPTQIYALNQDALARSTEQAAVDYQGRFHTAVSYTGGMLDLAVLGFGPDGHTCSLFPGHPLLADQTNLVAPITDSPKPPSDRITLTFPALNQYTRNAVFAGAGDSKSPILKAIFQNLRPMGQPGHYSTSLAPVYPCAMVRPKKEILYLVDEAAMKECLGGDETEPVRYARVLVADTKAEIPSKLLPLLVMRSQAAIDARGAFTIAMSGGSLPALLSGLPDAFDELGVEPRWEQWHVLLADERCVLESHKDSNMGSLHEHLFRKAGIPISQLYGLDPTRLDSATSVQAEDYERKVRSVMAKSGGSLDVALLGFGPDGHTCSLFEGHDLLDERTRWVAGIEDSPKQPPRRITLTYAVLNEWTRCAIFCGAGASKEPVLDHAFDTIEGRHGADFHARMRSDPPSALLPCARVSPKEELVWVVDAPALPKKDGLSSKIKSNAGAPVP